VLANTRRALRAFGRLPALPGQLGTVLKRAAKIVAQTRQRLAGQTPPAAGRLVWLHDPDARPIVKGRLGKRVEFGLCRPRRRQPRRRDRRLQRRAGQPA
jgi:IS5 family transposase